MLLQQSVDIGILLAGGNGDNALMGVGVGQSIKLLARQEANLHAAGAAIVDQALHPLVVALARDADILEAARARLQRFADRMNAVDDDHFWLQCTIPGSYEGRSKPSTDHELYRSRAIKMK